VVESGWMFVMLPVPEGTLALIWGSIMGTPHNALGACHRRVFAGDTFLERKSITVSC
jgi:hypothetical protein